MIENTLRSNCAGKQCCFRRTQPHLRRHLEADALFGPWLAVLGALLKIHSNFRAYDS